MALPYCLESGLGLGLGHRNGISGGILFSSELPESDTVFVTGENRSTLRSSLLRKKNSLVREDLRLSLHCWAGISGFGQSGDRDR